MEQIEVARYFDVIAKARKSYAHFLEPICRKWDLTRCELDILLFLFNNPSFSRAADIVERRGIAKSHVSLGVNALVSRGFLVRSAPAEDRRSTHLTLTDEGTTAAAEARNLQRAFFARVTEGISEEEAALWRGITEKVRDNIETL